MVDNTYIYGLYDLSDKDKTIRYIGKSDNPEKRLKRHIYNTKYHRKNKKKLTHKENWIIKSNFNVGFIVIEECKKDKWQIIEQELIKKYNHLTNTSKGGDGGSGVKYTISYEDCKKYVKKYIKPKSKSDWYDKVRDKVIPQHIPKNPREVFKSCWVSWGDFLGTGKVCDNYVNYLTYDDAKYIIHKMKLKKVADFKNKAKQGLIPDNIPNRPDRYYGKNKDRGWLGWSDFLGCEITQNQKKVFYELKQFKEKLNELNIKKMSDYKKYCVSGKRDEKMPTNPLTVYGRKYKGIRWRDFLLLH